MTANLFKGPVKLSVHIWVLWHTEVVQHCHGLTQQPAIKYQTAARSPLPFLPAGWGGETDRKKISWVEIKTV